jgi:aspartate aminotransferase-like enzyme
VEDVVGLIEPVLTMIPGPTPVHERILARLARPTVSHVDPEFVTVFRACLDNLRRIALGDKARPFVVAGAGTLAMEMALVNLVRPGEKLLVVSQGFFGDRWAELAGALGLEFDVLRSEWGSAVAPAELARGLGGGRYAAVALTHVDTSTGTAAPVAEYCELLRGREELVILDGVCALAGMEERFDDWGLDLLLTGAQKALGAPPGVAIVLASARALERRKAMPRVGGYYADLLRWLPIMEDPGRYFSTPAVNEIVALHEATEIVLQEGLRARFARHRRFADAIRAALEALGLAPFTRPECRADTLSVVRYPPGVGDAEFREHLARRGVIVAGALGPLAGRAFRVGHMGNVGAGEVCRLLHAVEQTLIGLGCRLRPGTALAATAPWLGEAAAEP